MLLSDSFDLPFSFETHPKFPDIGVIVAAIIFLKLSSPKRFYADPAVSLAISFIIFASAIPMSKRTLLFRAGSVLTFRSSAQVR